MSDGHAEQDATAAGLSSDGLSSRHGRASRPGSYRELYRSQMLNSIGGWSGTVIAAIPTVVFVIVNATTSLRPALFAAVGTALVLTVYRLARKQPTQQALSGLLGVVVAALIARHTGEARGYFLLGIITSFVYAVPVRDLDPGPAAAGRTALGVPRSDDPRRTERAEPAQQPIATRTTKRTPRTRQSRPRSPGTGSRCYCAPIRTRRSAASWSFMLRGSVQAALYGHDATGWLAVARIAMGFPLYIAAVGLGYWLIRQAREVFAIQQAQEQK